MEQIAMPPFAPSGHQALLKSLEGIVAEACGAQSFESVIALLQGTTVAGSACTTVWPAGSIAYRCKTCQTTASSAICVNCFKAGNHEGHDYIVYRSPSGGCCDCGDLSAWRLEGCCPRHRPGAGQSADLSGVLGERGAVALREVSVLALAGIAYHVTETLQKHMSPHESSVHSEAASALSKWLCQVASAPPLRAQLCAIAVQPLTDLIAVREAAVQGSEVQGVSSEIISRAKHLLQHPVRLPAGRKDSLSRRLVCLLEHMSDDTLVDVTTLLMLLLYDATFKYEATLHFLDFYLSMLRAVVASGLTPVGVPVKRGLGTALDRITVQLFNCEEVTIKLAREERAFQVIFEALHHLQDKVLKTLTASQAGSQEAASSALQALFGGYRRALGDLHTMAHWSSVAYILIMTPGLMKDHLLLFLTRMQCMVPQACIPPSQPAAREPHTAVSAASNLELITNHAIFEIVGTCMGGHTQNKTAEVQNLEMLTTGARSCLEALVDWASSQPLVASSPTDLHLDPRYIYQRILTGQQPVSPHLPLHRATATFIHALLSYEATGPVEHRAQASQTLASILQHLAAPCSPPQAAAPVWGQSIAAAALQATEPVTSSQAVARHVLMLQTMLSQISQRIWVRNGDDAGHVEVAYVMWRDFLQDPDLLLLMTALAAAPQSQLLTDMLQVMGAGPLLMAAGILPTVPTSSQLPEPGQSVGYVTDTGQLVGLTSAEDAIRLLVTLLRDRTLCGTNPMDRLRQLLLHTLALADMGHSQLVDALPSDLQHNREAIDQVLGELANYRPPSLSAPGQYCLKKEAWAGFDPHMHHMSRRTLPKALERAGATGIWKPHTQLKTPTDPLPPSLANLMNVLEHPQLVKLVAYVVQHHVSGGAPHLSEELLISALNLLALQLQHLEAKVASAGGALAADPQARTAASQCAHVLAPMLLGQDRHGHHMPGVLVHLRRMAGLSGPVQHTGHGHPSHTQHCGADVVDCCKHLVTEAERVLGTVQREGLLPEGVPEPAGGAGGQNGGKGALSPAEEARARARQRQEALMASMRAAQAAFLKNKPATPPNFMGQGTSMAAAAEGSGSEAEGDGGSEGVPEEDRGVVNGGDMEEDEDSADADSDGMLLGEETGTLVGLVADEATGQPERVEVPTRVLYPPCQRAMGTWAHAAGECVLCQSATSSHRTGPLGWVGHVGICSCVAAPLTPDRLPPSWQGSAQQPAGSPAAATDMEVSEPAQQAAAPAAATSSAHSAQPAVQQVPSAADVSPSARMGDRLVQWRLQTHGPAYSLVDYQPGCHVHTCGHMMHYKCFVSYRENIQAAAESDSLFPGFHLLSMARREFLCPMCRRLSNCLFPAARFNWQPASAPRAAAPTSPSRSRGASRRTTAVAAVGSAETTQLPNSPNTRQETPQHELITDTTPGASTADSTQDATAMAVDSPTTSQQQCQSQVPAMLHAARTLLRGLQPVIPGALGAGSGMQGAPTAASQHNMADEGLAAVTALQAAPLQYGSAPSGARSLAATSSDGAAAAVAGVSARDGPRISGHPQGGPRRLSLDDGDPTAGGVDRVPVRTWQGVAAGAFMDLGPMALDLTKQVSVEILKHAACIERALEARAQLTALQLTAAHRHLQAHTGPITATQPEEPADDAMAVAGPGQPLSPDTATAAHQATRDTATMHNDPVPLLSPPADVVRYLEPPTLPRDTGSTAFVTAQAPSAGLVATAAYTHVTGSHAALPAAAPCIAATGPPVAWQPAYHGETVAEARRRWQHEPLTPTLWAMLAHNLVHWEALRRPVLLQGRGSPLVPDTIVTPTSTATLGAPQQPAPLRGGGCITGQPLVEAAHINAVQSILQLCVAVGSSTESGAQATSHLASALHWLLGDSHPSQPAVGGSSHTQLPAGHTAAGASTLHEYGRPPPAPVCVSAGLLTEYDSDLARQLLELLLDKRSDVPNRGLRALCSRQAADMRQLVADPLLLVLELFALALSAHGVPAAGAAPAQRLLHPAAAGPSGQHSPSSLLTAVLQLVLPVVTVQTVAWLSGQGAPTDLAAWQQRTAEALQQSQRAGAGAQELQDAVAAHLLPFLVRCYLLHNLLQEQRPDDALMLAYAALTPSCSQHSVQAAAHADASSTAAAAHAKCLQLADALCARLGLQSVQQALGEGTLHTLGSKRQRRASTDSMQMDGGSAPSETSGVSAPPATALPLLVRWAGHLAWAADATTLSPSLQPASALSLSNPPTGSHGRANSTVQQPATVSHLRLPDAPTGQVALAGTGVHPAVATHVTLSPWAVLRPSPRLIPLPHTFQDLFLQLTDKPCYMCGKVSEQPSLCLVTGRLLCSWWRGCQKNYGGGMLHAMEACAGNALLLSLRSTKVVCLRPNRLTMCQSPYLDSHGEEDTDLKRGRPLYLNNQVYSQLSALWAGSATEFDSHMLQSSRVDLTFL